MGMTDVAGGQLFPVSATDAWPHLQYVAARMGTVKESDEFLHRIVLSTGVSAFAWGETVSVSLEPVSESSCRLVVAAHAKAGWSLGLMGTRQANTRNAKHVEKLISDLSASLRAVQQRA